MVAATLGETFTGTGVAFLSVAMLAGALLGFALAQLSVRVIEKVPDAPSAIVLQFVMEAAAVSAVGGALGTLVGLSGATLVSQITPLAATVKPLTVLFGVSFSGAVGLLFGIWPAARAANLDPVEALRYE